MSKPGISRLVCVAGAVLFLIYGCALASESVAGFAGSHTTQTHWPWLGDKPVGEDGFYMLTVADNLAVKHHLVYNQDMPATGIQPLATVVFAGIAFAVHQMGGDRWTLVRAVIVFGTLLFLFFAWMMASFASLLAPPTRRDLVFSLAFFLTLLDFTAFRLFTYGLETGIYLCLIAVCVVVWRRVVAGQRAAWVDLLMLGGAAGFAGLARIDFGLLFAVLLAFLLVKRIASLVQTLVAGVVALAIVSPWFLFVHKVSGEWLPSSGKAESGLIGADGIGRAISLMLAATAHLAPWSFTASGNILTTVFGVFSLVLICAVFLYASETRLALRSSVDFRATFLPWLVGIALMALVYLTLFESEHFYARYLSPILVLWVPLLSLALAESRIIQRYAPAIPITLLIFFCLWDLPSLHMGHVGSSQFLTAGYIHAQYPDSRVGAFQSGVEGYFNPNVENLDGKLNQGALRALRQHRLDNFIDSEHIDVLVDWPGYFSLLPVDYIAREWGNCPKAMPAPESVCFVHK